MTTLAVKTYQANYHENGPWEDLMDTTAVPAEGISHNRGENAGPYDAYHLQAWSFSYGFAYAVARTEDPFGTEEGWRTAAREAASKALRWHTSVGGRPGGES